jgi:hypothetical protein
MRPPACDQKVGLPKVAPDGVRNLVKKHTGRVDLPQAPDRKHVLLQNHACVGAGVKKALLVPGYALVGMIIQVPLRALTLRGVP